MSATSGVLYPLWTNPFLINSHASASFIPCTVIRTISQPASARRMTCSIVFSTSRVFDVVMDWIRMGFEPPIGTFPTITVRVWSRFV
jgi:hypothetical protein